MRIMRVIAPFLATICLLGGSSGLVAQEPAMPELGTEAGERQLIDRIIAVVGDSIVLESTLNEKLLELTESGQPLPRDPVGMARLRADILNGMVEELLVIEAALLDSVEVPEERVQELVADDLRRREQTFGGRSVLETALAERGLTYVEYRDLITREYRKRALIETYLGRVRQQRSLPPVDEQEVREVFEAQRARFGSRPATVTFRQVVLAPRATEEAREAARAQAEEILAMVRAGEDFAVLARRFSQDPGSREQGGDLGWFRRGQMVPEFDRAAYALTPGQVSPVVETAFGYHIVKLEKVRGAERQARHILIRPDMTQSDTERVELTAQLVATELEQGTSIESLIERYHDPVEESEVGPYPRDQLPPPYGEILGAASPGSLIGPVRLAGHDAEKWAVIQVDDIVDAGEYAYEDVRTQLRRQVQEQKLVEEVVRDLRERTYVDVRL